MIAPKATGILLLLFSAHAVSLRETLLCIPIVAITAAVIGLIGFLSKKIHCPLSSGASALLSVGFGNLLCALLNHFFADISSVTEPLLAALLLTIGCVITEEGALPFLVYPAVVMIGLLRELLTTGGVWEVVLIPKPGAFQDVVGGMLIAAVVFFVFGLSHPVLETVPFFDGLLSAVIPVAAALLFRFIPLSPLLALWASATVVAVTEAFLPRKITVGPWLVTIPFVLLSENNLPFLTVFLFTVIVAAPLVRRLRLLPPLRRFTGVPCTAVITAVVRGIVSAVF